MLLAQQLEPRTVMAVVEVEALLHVFLPDRLHPTILSRLFLHVLFRSCWLAVFFFLFLNLVATHLIIGDFSLANQSLDLPRGK